MKLHIRNITKEDFMEYRCVARNSLGDSDGSITLYGKLWSQISKCFGRLPWTISHTEVSRPTPSTTTVVTTIGPETTSLRRQRMRGEADLVILFFFWVSVVAAFSVAVVVQFVMEHSCSLESCSQKLNTSVKYFRNCNNSWCKNGQIRPTGQWYAPSAVINDALIMQNATDYAECQSMPEYVRVSKSTPQY